MQWMLWTLPTACFFAVIAIVLVAMTIWEIVSPTTDRRGWIVPMRTTRGDRLFIGLLASAYICAFWVAVVPLSMWWMLGVSILLVAVLVLWG